MRRVHAVDLMLLGTVLLWALNITVTKYVLDARLPAARLRDDPLLRGDGPLLGLHLQRERSFAIALSDAKLVALAGSLIFVNQIGFVYGLHTTSASTVALILGTTPIFIGIFVTLFGFERLGRRFWAAALCSFIGVGFVALGQRRRLREDRRRPAGALHGRDVGGLLGHDRPADAALLAVSDQRRRARDRLGADRGRRAPSRQPTRGFTSAGRPGSGSRSRSSGRCS